MVCAIVPISTIYGLFLLIYEVLFLLIYEVVPSIDLVLVCWALEIAGSRLINKGCWSELEN